MTDREKVIKGLECCISKDDRCDECPYMTGKEQIGEMNGEPEYVYGCDRLALTTDALALLKAPRVMALEEALIAEVNVDQCWLEVKDIKQIYLADAVACPEHTERADIQRWGASDCQLPLDLYGAYWRMWDRKPTKEQREAVKWE